MDPELLKILSEEIRETRNLTVETRRMTEETRKMTIDISRKADETRELAREAKRQADAAWELVIITRNQVDKELAHLKLPWWKKLAGKAA